jgi:hypothetical protein
MTLATQIYIIVAAICASAILAKVTTETVTLCRRWPVPVVAVLTVVIAVLGGLLWPLTVPAELYRNLRRGSAKP